MLAKSIIGDNIIAKIAGKALSNYIQKKIFTKKTSTTIDHNKLNFEPIQDAFALTPIPIALGRVKVRGHIIWLDEVKQSIETTVIKQKSQYHVNKRIDNYYKYSTSFAVAICQGPIDYIEAVYIDGVYHDFAEMSCRQYHGTMTQMPDPLIEKRIGFSQTPAFRGLAYVVFEDMSIDHAIPHIFEFVINKSVGQKILYNNVTGIYLLPGCGEFVYATTKVTKQNCFIFNEELFSYGDEIALNKHLPGGANVLHALDDLERQLPSANYIAIIAAWFVCTLDAKSARLKPAVEYDDNSITNGLKWSVASYERHNAYVMQQTHGRPRYGGTPSDNSILEVLIELKSRGKKVMFNPMFFVDIDGKPWRGLFTGEAEEVATFIRTEYRDFIMHYVNLTSKYIDAFVLGSELIGITKAHDNHRYLGVEALCELACDVKASLDANVILTYAADWSEYHHTEGGYYNLDELWACSAIDVIGIDAYFPLTEDDENCYDVEHIKNGFYRGEGFDYYKDYKGLGPPIKLSLDKKYAWKNIRWWWENKHINPDGVETKWHPCSKPIWFTEFGFASMDLTTNAPNIFFSEDSKDMPFASNGSTNYKIQKTAINALLLFCKENSDMIANYFLWGWDARPFPLWPNRKDLWSDSESYYKGHWIQGKVEANTLSDIIQHLFQGIESPIIIDTSELYDQVLGVLLQDLTPLNLLSSLQSFYNVVTLYEGNVLKYKYKKNTKEFALEAYKMWLSHFVERISSVPKVIGLSLVYLDHNELEYDSIYLPKENSNEHLSLVFPIVLDRVDAIAKSQLIINLLELSNYQIQFRIIYQDYNAISKIGDCIAFEGVNYTIIKTQFIAFNIIDYTAIIYNQYVTTHKLIDEKFSPVEELKTLYIIAKNIAFGRYNIAVCAYKTCIPDMFVDIELHILDQHNNRLKLLERKSIEVNGVIGIIGGLDIAKPYTIYYDALILYVQNGALQEEGYILIADEIIYYKNFDKISEFCYRLKQIVRGMFASNMSAHNTKTKFIVLQDISSYYVQHNCKLLIVALLNLSEVACTELEVQAKLLPAIININYGEYNLIYQDFSFIWNGDGFDGFGKYSDAMFKVTKSKEILYTAKSILEVDDITLQIDCVKNYLLY